MKVNNASQSNNTFGSLYISSESKIIKKAGNRFVEAINKAKPTLEYYAEDFDIHIIPYKFNSESRGLAIKATIPTKNPIKHFFTRLNMKYEAFNKHMCFPSSKSVRLAPLIGGYINLNSADDIAELLKIQAEELTNQVLELLA